MHTEGSVEEDLVDFFQRVAFGLSLALPRGSEHTARDLFSNVIFHPIFFRFLLVGGELISLGLSINVLFLAKKLVPFRHH